jgi:hypothetical protein
MERTGNMKDPERHAGTGAEATRLGVRCAWCGRILREPVGLREDPLAWTHGICSGCQQRFEAEMDAPLINAN